MTDIEYDIERYQIEIKLDTQINELDELITGLMNLELVEHSIDKYGITPSLESFIGGVFDNKDKIVKTLSDGYKKILSLSLSIIDTIKNLMLKAKERLIKITRENKNYITNLKGSVELNKNNELKLPYSVTRIKDIEKFMVFIKDMMATISEGKLTDEAFKFYNDVFDVVVDTKNNKIIRWVDKSNTNEKELKQIDDSIFDLDYLFKLVDWVIREPVHTLDKLKRNLEDETDTTNLKRRVFEIKLYKRNITWVINNLITRLTKYNRIFKKLIKQEK